MYCVNCGTQLPDNSQFCFSCGNKTNANMTASSTNSVNNAANAKKIKGYLLCAKRLETHLLTLNKTKTKIQNKISTLGYYQNIKKPRATFELTSFCPIAAFVLLLIGSLIYYGIKIGNIIDFDNFIDVIDNSLKVTLLGSIAVAVIFLIVDITDNVKKTKNYKQNINQDKARVENEQRQIAFLKREEAAIDNKISEVEATLNKLYSLNVIYPKYRSLVPIVTMYEYFDSGRHTNLVDAYNKYEDELLHKNIIEKLDVVISQLDQIKQNQYSLYEAIQESNYLSEQIYQKSESLLASNQAIEQHSAVAAYNSKVAADNSSIAAYINSYH